MNRLWVRMSLYFTGLVLAGVLIIVGVAGVLASDRVNQLLLPDQLRNTGGIVDTLADYYRDHRSWTGVEGLMQGVGAAAPIWSDRLDLTLADANGRLIYRERPRPGQPDEPPSRHPHTSIPIQVEGKTVGELLLSTRTPRSGPRPDLPGQVSRLLIWIALGGGAIGIVVSVIASRSLTAPLSHLAAAAHDIGARNFAHRVEPTGSDEVVEVANAFNAMAARLEEAETLRRNLVADVAHELRTPLSVLQGNLRAILDDVYTLDKVEITRLYTQTRLLSRLVNDLHELAQAEAGQLSLNRQPVDLAELIRETSEAYAPVAEEAGVTLQTDIPAALPLLSVDPTRLAQVLHNLLSNALRHTPAGGLITLRATAVQQAVSITVTDSGEGIAVEHLAHVFDRFYRIDRSRARDTGGAGLGLAIVRAIVEAHEGQVEVASQGPGQGSTFTLQLPIDRQTSSDPNTPVVAY
jgi:signal transduction histidine kinase